MGGIILRSNLRWHLLSNLLFEFVVKEQTWQQIWQQISRERSPCPRCTFAVKFAANFVSRLDVVVSRGPTGFMVSEPSSISRIVDELLMNIFSFSMKLAHSKNATVKKNSVLPVVSCFAKQVWVRQKTPWHVASFRMFQALSFVRSTVIVLRSADRNPSPNRSDNDQIRSEQIWARHRDISTIPGSTTCADHHKSPSSQQSWQICCSSEKSNGRLHSSEIGYAHFVRKSICCVPMYKYVCKTILDKTPYPCEY